jgi:hypothetical protein
VLIPRGGSSNTSNTGNQQIKPPTADETADGDRRRRRPLHLVLWDGSRCHRLVKPFEANTVQINQHPAGPQGEMGV